MGERARKGEVRRGEGRELGGKGKKKGERHPKYPHQRSQLSHNNSRKRRYSIDSKLTSVLIIMRRIAAGVVCLYKNETLSNHHLGTIIKTLHDAKVNYTGIQRRFPTPDKSSVSVFMR